MAARDLGQMRIGLDLGGTKTEIIALGAGGEELHRKRVPTPRDDYDATLSAIVDLVTEAEDVLGEAGSVGVGVPGAVSPATGVMKNANSVWLMGKPLRQDLEERLGRPRRLERGAGGRLALAWGVVSATPHPPRVRADADLFRARRVSVVPASSWDPPPR